jgi:hypothetical protein
MNSNAKSIEAARSPLEDKKARPTLEEVHTGSSKPNNKNPLVHVAVLGQMSIKLLRRLVMQQLLRIRNQDNS